MNYKRNSSFFYFFMQEKKKKYIDGATALYKLQHFCAYQERAHEEVKTKLIELGVYGETQDEVIISLIQDNFLNEERFAKIFARGKFSIKKWGRIKIKQELKLKKVSDYCIRKAMEEIEQDDYLLQLSDILTKKNLILDEDDSFKRRQKLFAYAQQKGYETELIINALRQLL